MIGKDELIERLKELGKKFEQFYAAGEWHKADQMYQRFLIVTGLLEMTRQDLKEIYDECHYFQMYKTDRALEKAGLRAVSNDPFGIRKMA